MHTPETPPQPRLHLTEARNQRQLSQQELADRIGTTYVNVSRWERGITKPSPYFRRKLCTLFGKTEEELDLLPAPGSEKRGREDAPSSAKSVASAQAITSSARPVPLYDPAIPLQPAIALVGRDHDLAHIKQRLRSVGSVALTALNGLPGVGKTALSITLAHDEEIRAHFHDGVLWAGLGPDPNMPGLLSRWGTLLGISPAQMATLSNDEAWARAIRTAIGSRRMLIVIDDAWRLEEALMVRVGGPQCAHLVTTRFPSIASHMAAEGATMIQELNREESITLLKMLAPQVVNREEQKVDELVQAVGGLPLALTLMGNYLRKQAYSGPARRITAALERLSDAEERLQLNEPHVPVESHPSLPIETSLSLKSIISVTDQLLSQAARTALYALAVFPPKPNSFSEDAALVVAACTIDDLDALTDAGLLESTGVERDRYTLHQVIADYARLHLTEHAAYERLIAYVSDYVDVHKKDYEMLELESSTIRYALDIAYEQDKQENLIRTACEFAPFLILRGFYPEAEMHLQRAQEAAIALGDEHGVMESLLYLGEVAQKQGNYAQAEEDFQRGLALAHKAGDNELICALLTDLGDVNWRRGKSTQAETYLQEGLSLARQSRNMERTCILLKTLGSVFGSRGNFAQSEAYLQEGLSLARQLGNIEQICTLLGNLGTTAGGQGNYAQAKTYLEEGLTLARQIGHREQICVLLLNLGDAARELGNYIQAEAYSQEGLELARQIGHRQWISALLINLGLMLRKQRNYDQAQIYLQESLTLAKQIGSPRLILTALYENGHLYLDKQQVEMASIAFQEMLTIMPEGAQDQLASARYGLARVAAAQGNIEEARKLGESSLMTLEVIRDPKEIEVRQWLDSIRE